MEKGKTLKSINRSYHGHMKSLTRAGRERDILAALSNGKNTYMRMDRVESSSYDSSWIDEIENVIFDLGTIIANPKQVTKAEGNIVPVELARKISAESVQHLASHTQYVKEIANAKRDSHWCKELPNNRTKRIQRKNMRKALKDIISPKRGKRQNKICICW